MSSTELLQPPASAASPRVRRSEPRSTLPAPERRPDPAWARPALVALLALTAAAYLWDLTASGWANSFYAAAVQAGTKSWKAMLFGSLDSSNFITVDKPPASLWVMALSGRIFGFSSASMLVPQVLEGVGAVALLHATVKRWFGAGAGLTAGAVFALTPVAALMFRFNNPDALLVLLLVAAAWCLVRALEQAGTRWVLAAGAMIGFAFLAKMMQAFLVLPAFASVYLLAAPAPLRRRAGQLAAGALAMLASCGWWVALVALWPASSRPMIDGSASNSIIDLITGYNGLGRIFGASGPAGAGGGASFSGATGPLRLFNSLMGGQASWLLPAALLALACGLWGTRGRPRTDRTRAALILWGGWLLVTAAVFSFGQGVIHTYYAVALAPAIAALVAIGARHWHRRRHTLAARVLAAAGIAGSAVWADVLLTRTPSFEPWLRPLVLAAGVLAAAGVALAPRARRVYTATALAAAFALLAGPAAYSAETITTAHTGSIVSAGPTVSSAVTGAPGSGGFPGGSVSSQRPPSAPSAMRGTGGAPSGAGGGRSGAGAAPTGSAQAGVSAALVKALRSDSGRYRWAAATSGAQNAAELELASGEAVMAIGGFNGQGGRLSLAAFERYVADGEIHYWIAGSGGGPGGDTSSAIASWVAAHFTARTIGGQTVYELS